MFRVQNTCIIGIVVLVLLCVGDSAVGFNPQPEPPANQWGIEGFIDMTALKTAPTGSTVPFGVDSEIIGDDLVDFHAGIRASFIAPDDDGDLKPDDGLYAATTEFFDVVIGDTQWSHTIISRDFDLQLDRGVVTSVRCVISGTLREHPDLEFTLASSFGNWIATDERYGDNLGTISGTYALRDAIVLELIPGDLNGDGLVSSGDLDIVRAWWGAKVTPGELNHGDATGDGYVGSGDLDTVRANWGAKAAAVPEPATVVLGFAGAVLLTWQRRQR